MKNTGLTELVLLSSLLLTGASFIPQQQQRFNYPTEGANTLRRIYVSPDSEYTAEDVLLAAQV